MPTWATPTWDTPTWATPTWDTPTWDTPAWDTPTVDILVTTLARERLRLLLNIRLPMTVMVFMLLMVSDMQTWDTPTWDMPAWHTPTALVTTTDEHLEQHNPQVEEMFFN